MKIQIYNRAQAKAYTIPVGSGSTYAWKKQEEEYITVIFSSDFVLSLKKGFYTNIEGLGRFEVVDLPTPTAASKNAGYDYELRLDRPWYKFKNRIIFFRRGSVNGMEAKWSLTDTLQAHAGILTDNLSEIGYTYGGKDYMVYIHEDVEKRNEAKLIAYDSTTLLSSLDQMAETFDTEWWIEENIIHFGRCEQGDKTITLEQHKELNGLSRSEDSEEHGTRLYAFGSSRNLNQNYRRKLKNPFTIDGIHDLYSTKVRFTTNKPKTFYSENMRIKITSYSKYAGQTFTFKVVSGSYGNPAAGQTASWNNPVFEIEVSSMTDAIGFQNGTGVQFIIGDETGGQTDDSKTTMVKIERDSYQIFSFKDLQLQKKAITRNSTITLADKTTTGIEFIGIASDGTNNVNDSRDCYALTDKTKKLVGSQQVTLAHLAMAYINKFYTEPIDGQSEVAIQGVSDTILQLPIGTPYIDSDPNLDPDDITDIVKTYEDIYPRALLTITEVTEIPAKTTDTDTGNVTYWTAYRFKAKLQDGSPFVFDSIYETQEENKPLSIHFESGQLNGMDFEVHFNPDADTDDRQLFEITRNDTYTLELPNETMKPAVGDTLFMYNMDITFIDDELVEAAEMELKAEAEKDMKKMKVDNGTYTGTKNPLEFGKRKIELTYGSKVKLIAPEYFDTEDHARESRIIGWELNLEDTTQGELTIGESKAYSNSESLASTVDEIVYYNNQIQNTTAQGNIPAYDKLITELQNKMTFLEKRMDTKLSKVFEDSARQLINLYKGMTVGEFVSGQFGKGGYIDQMGRAELHSLTLRDFLETPEYRCNRVSIQIGNRWRAAGGGIIEEVIPDTDSDGNKLSTGTIVLHLQDGEIGKIAVDDICQGIWHEGMSIEDNESDDFDDGIGNFKFAGFYTAYFRITEIIDTTHNSRVRYALRPTSDTWSNQHHPHDMMHFVAYGNFSDTTRQKSRYSTLTYERYLTDVNNWEFSKDMIAAQFGDLTNLNIFGFNMKGYSAYLNNIYMTGTIEQFENMGRKMLIDQSLDGYMAVDETETVTIQIVDGYLQDHTEEYTFKVERDTGDSASDAVWNAKPEHLNCGSQFNISYEDLHINPNHSGISTLFYVTADDGKEAPLTEPIEY
jgi:hypothetical protein|nr:MAG TPA: tail protein [Caudoviricetes sp.]